MQGACEENLFFRFPGAVKCGDIFVFNNFDIKGPGPGLGSILHHKS